MSPTMMKALRKMSRGRGLQMDKVAVPEIGPTDALIRVRAASICGTDLHIFGWDRWSQGRIKPPLTLGHEFCGHVEKVGDEARGIAPGDFVSAEMHVNCGYCHQCRVGQPHICQNLEIIGIDRDGAFAEFVRIPARNVWKVDASIPERYAAILDPLGNAVHTVLAGEIAGHTVAVTGCGPIGLMAIAVARACGCSTLIATEVNEHRASLAKPMGADEVINPAETDAVARVRELTGGTGVDVLLEMSGNPTAIQQGFQMLRSGGRASLLGIPNKPVNLNLVEDVIFKGATVQGIYGRKMFETWVQMTSLLKSGRLNLEPLFRERYPLEGFQDAFALLRGGQAGKVLFYPNGDGEMGKK
ncbi:MAG: L-threonine 3-dehydrogenase [Acidobacteria bacterium]|nr:L-threonine 3-dehydrogenase [Acidobacteriota bacterium]MCL5287004.1 L-threonine 3-dehydrogenase [Acidobacteriota bacterium]